MVRLFGTTIKETREAFGDLHLDFDQQVADRSDRVKAIGRIVVTILLIFLAVYLFASGSKDVGGTIVGAITGYWLK